MEPVSDVPDLSVPEADLSAALISFLFYAHWGIEISLRFMKRAMLLQRPLVYLESLGLFINRATWNHIGNP